ncbi:MAG: pyridoxal phosphate-dependent aminotransferase [Myxococcales bacterium]|nr:MAG: pyridoxal phosphate-dependent aminotransferase [Myxococcales bacterium]
MPRFPKLSTRTAALSDGVFSALMHEAKTLDKPVYPLHVGDTYLEPIKEAMAESQRSAEIQSLHCYSPVRGEPVLLEQIASKLRRQAANQAPSIDNIQVVNGATAGLSVICESLFEAGDEVIVLSPFWPLIRGILQKSGVKVIELPFFTERDYAGFDFKQALQQLVSPRTAAIYLNSPNNPTGKSIARAELDVIAELAKQNDWWILCDEAYEDLFFDKAQQACWLHPDLHERSIVAHTISKSYGLAGARIGYIHGPEQAMAAIRSVQTFHSYCASKPMQYAAAAALEKGDAWQQDARARYAHAANLCSSILGIERIPAGTFAFFDVSPYFSEGQDMHSFLRRCLRHGVLLTPGSACGKDYQSWVRLCFTVLPPEELETALRQLRSAFNC